MTLSEYINQLSDGDLRAALTKCCAATQWGVFMTAARPFASDEQVLGKADEIWNGLNREDWLEAFAAHPKIGDVESLRQKYGNTREWAGREQAGVAEASEATLWRLAELNREYETKFGYIFIVCATGKSAEEMLDILESRLHHDAATEIHCAAAEQLKITFLRLNKLVS